MGLDYHGLNFMRYAAKLGAFGKTVTIARQEIHLNALMAGAILGDRGQYVHEKYCDNVLRSFFGASSVDSVDMSDFEDATILHDMNQPIPDAQTGLFDTLIDAGCLEHVFSINTALQNCSRLIREGGQILHVLPANNFCGHGFWQFSPELFFSLYSPENGYEQTEVFVSDYLDHTYWYKVRKPQNGQRVNIYSSSEVYVMVRTVKARPFSHEQVQQSDYTYEWEQSVRSDDPVPTPGGLKGLLMRFPAAHEALFTGYHRLRRLASKERLSANNPGLERVRIKDLIGRQA